MTSQAMCPKCNYMSSLEKDEWERHTAWINFAFWDNLVKIFFKLFFLKELTSTLSSDWALNPCISISIPLSQTSNQSSLQSYLIILVMLYKKDIYTITIDIRYPYQISCYHPSSRKKDITTFPFNNNNKMPNQKQQQVKAFNYEKTVIKRKINWENAR